MMKDGHNHFYFVDASAPPKLAIPEKKFNLRGVFFDPVRRTIGRTFIDNYYREVLSNMVFYKYGIQV